MWHCFCPSYCDVNIWKWNKTNKPKKRTKGWNECIKRRRRTTTTMKNHQNQCGSALFWVSEWWTDGSQSRSPLYSKDQPIHLLNFPLPVQNAQSVHTKAVTDCICTSSRVPCDITRRIVSFFHVSVRRVLFCRHRNDDRRMCNLSSGTLVSPENHKTKLNTSFLRK